MGEYRQCSTGIWYKATVFGLVALQIWASRFDAGLPCFDFTVGCSLPAWSLERKSKAGLWGNLSINFHTKRFCRSKVHGWEKTADGSLTNTLICRTYWSWWALSVVSHCSSLGGRGLNRTRPSNVSVITLGLLCTQPSKFRRFSQIGIRISRFIQKIKNK